VHYITTIDYAEHGTQVGYYDVDGPFEEALIVAERLTDTHSVVSIYRRPTDGQPDLLWSTRDERPPHS
jgi:hypothetical protein